MFQLLHDLLDLLFPPQCVNCQAIGSWMCQACLNKIPILPITVCLRCGEPISMVNSASCRRCASQPLKNIDQIRTVSYFEDNPVHSAIYALKYYRHKAIAGVLGQLLAEAYLRYKLKADVVVPVPLHSSRYRERGYNQSELLAKELSHLLNLPLNTTTLCRIKKTETQAKLKAIERHSNVSQAFACRENSLAGQEVLLIDDVYTTGSTLEACAVALKASGVKVVLGFTVARA